METAMATEPTNLRLDVETKKAAFAIFEEVGMKPAQAINLFLRQVVLQEGLPFEVKIPNSETLEAMREAESGDDSRTYGSFADLRNELDV